MHVPEYLTYSDHVSWPCSNYLTFFPTRELKITILHPFVNAAEVKFKYVNLRRHKQPLFTLRRWQTRTHCCGNIVAHDVSLRTQTGKHLSRTQNVSEQNQKQLCPGHKICVRNKCCARGQTGKHFCRQQCVRNNVSSFASTFNPTELVN